MLIRIIKYIKGYVYIRVTGYSPERFINLCSNHSILIWGLKHDEDAYYMYMSIKGLRRLRPIVKKTKTRIKVEERHGLPFFLHKYRKRKMFFGGIVICTIMIYVLSLFIWNIHIEGNAARTDDVILEYLRSEQTYHGIRKSDVDCELIVSGIRKEFDDIIWASAEIRGTRLIIHVKENTDTSNDNMSAETSEEPSDLIADKDGIITEIITRAGVPAVSIGDVVKEGDLLISGRIEVLDDAGEVAGYQYSASDSDIYAKTIYEYEDEFPLEYTERVYSGQSKKAVYFKCFDKKIHIWSPTVDYKEYDAVTDEKQGKIGENFYLPLSFCTITYSEYESAEKIYADEEAKAEAEVRLSQYLEELSKKGVQIIENNVTILVDQNTCRASGKIQVQEEIGRRVATEILQVPVKEDEAADPSAAEDSE